MIVKIPRKTSDRSKSPRHSGSLSWGMGATLLIFGASGCSDGGSSEGLDKEMAGASGGQGERSNQGGDNGAGKAPSVEPALGGPDPLVCDPDKSTVAPTRLWRLTRTQYDNVVEDLLGDNSKPAARSFLPEVGSNGFLGSADQLYVRETDASLMRNAAQTLAERAVAQNFEKVFGCGPDKSSDGTCRDSFVEDFGMRAFRRPVSSDETTRYVALYDAGEKAGAKLGVRAVVEAMLQSPNFMFRFELGDSKGKTRLTAFETASALAFFFTNSMPDGILMKAAEDGALNKAGGIETQARRLMNTPRGQAAMGEFFRQLFEYDELKEAAKDDALANNWEKLRGDMLEETRLFVQEALFGEASNGSLETLFTANYSFVNKNLAALYEVEVKGDGFERTSLPDERAGILTQPGLLSHLAVVDRTSPVNRGRFVRERLLCDPPPLPPAGTDTSIAELDPGLTRREQLEQKTSGGACAGCHQLMNPIGFGLENFDGVGRYRDMENGSAIDASGELTNTRDIDGAFEGGRALAEKLASSAQVQECMTLQMFRYALGRMENEGDSCVVKKAFDAFKSKGLDLRELAVSIATSDAFVQRKGL